MNSHKAFTQGSIDEDLGQWYAWGHEEMAGYGKDGKATGKDPGQ